MDTEVTAEQLANKVLDKMKSEYGKIEFPIDPFNLLKREGIIISFSDFDRLEGIILNDKDNATIVGINKNRPWTRQRYTAAHEYCHYIKDLKKSENEVNRIDCLVGAKSKVEKFADRFAGCLLMPKFKVKELCDKYKNQEGFIDFENVTYMAEYFGVSFKSCVNRLAYDFKMIDGDISPNELNKRINKYKPEAKRKELISKNNDFLLIGNAIDSLSYCMVDLSTNIGAKFLNNYIYYDNRLEGITEENVPYILADLNYNKEKSEFLKTENENIIMTIGNYKLQEYILTTDDKISILNCRYLHKLLNSCVPFPEYAGNYRENDAVILNGTIQPSSYIMIESDIRVLSEEFDFFVKNIDDLKMSEYIERVVYFIYRFIKIHPFSDGNGRVSRALLNWMLRLKKIPPIYVDDKSRDEYYKALSKIDLEGDYLPFIIFVEKRIINTLTELHDYLFTENWEG